MRKRAPQSYRPQKQRETFYGSVAWQRFVAEIKRERGNICADRRCTTPDRGRGQRIHADHIVERKDGGAEFDKSNIMLRCSACHVRKTNQVAALRRAAAHQAANWTDWSGWRGEA